MNKLIIQLKKYNTIIQIVLFIVLFTFFPLELSSNALERSRDLVVLDKVLQNTVMVWLCFLFFSKNFKLIFIPIGLFLSFWEQEVNFFSSYIHPLLSKFPSFYCFITHKNTVNDISAEYPRIILICIILLIYGLCFLIKNFKVLDRIFVFLIASSVIATSFLFHFIIIKESELFKESLYRTMIVSAQLKKSEVCKELLLECHFFALKDYDEVIGQLPYLYVIGKNIKKDFVQYRQFNQKLLISNPIENNRLIGQIPVLMNKQAEEISVVNGLEAYQDFLIQNQFIYAYLALSAHTVWIMGGLFLIFFHKYRFKRRKLTS